MKRVTASEARKCWFRLLDEVAAGEVVVIERNGAFITLRRNEDSPIPRKRPPDYRRLLRVPDADRADTWGWTWGGSERGLKPRTGRGS